MIHRTGVLTAVVAAAFLAQLTEASKRFVVGPDETYKTISSALSNMNDGDVCIITEGIYRECVVVRQNNVTLRGQGRVVITGCDEAGPMLPYQVNGHKGLIKAIKTPVYDVFWGQHYLTPARYPDKVFPMTSNEDWENTLIGPNGTIDFQDHAQNKFPKLDDGYYVGLHGAFGAKHGKLSSWYSLTLPITGIGDNGDIHVDAENASSGFMGKYGKGSGLGYMIGSKAVLDASGEWYTDGSEVILIPPTGTSGNCQLRVRLYGALVTGNQVQFENIRFRAAAMRVDGDEMSLNRCVFEYISPFQHNANDSPQNRKGQSMASCWGVPDNGTAGVFVQGDRLNAKNCRFSKSWWCGMMILGNEAHIENCLFEDMNWMAKRCAGLFSWGKGNTVRYCTFRNLGGAAIEGGNANWIKQYAMSNIWEYNYIEDIGKLIVDQGFFYVNHQSGANPKAESIWRYNVGKSSQGPKKGNWTQTSAGYYVDNSSSGYRIHNNIAIDAKEAIRYNDSQDGPKAGKDVWYYNNTFYNCTSVAFGCWTKPDAELILMNNLAVPSGSFIIPRYEEALNWKNNFDSLPVSVFKDPDAMDFTLTDEKLQHAGIPVKGQTFSYIGAVDPAKGMWRYGVDESKLPTP